MKQIKLSVERFWYERGNFELWPEALSRLPEKMEAASAREVSEKYLQRNSIETVSYTHLLDYKYIEENGKDAVAVIRAAFKQIKDHKDYTAINNNGESCPIFGDDEYIRLENPANFVAAFRCFQELGEYIDDQSNRVKATLKDLSDDVQGRLYDVLLRGKYDNKVGQATYLTPREVTEAMTAMVLHDITSDSKEASKLIAVDGKGRPTFRVLDPTCGSGGFLIKAYLEICLLYTSRCV